MSLDAGNLFACIVSFLFCTVGIVDALRVNNNEAGCGLAPQFLAGLANRFFKARSRALIPADRALPTWRDTNTQCAPLGKALGKHAPLAAALEQVQQRVEDLM
jgi:hypothetical protein